MMGTLQEQLSRLRRFRTAVQKSDPNLAEESADLEAIQPELSGKALDEAVELESIAMRRERPVLAINNNVTKLEFVDQADSAIWSDRLKKAQPLLDQVIPAVGRINLRRSPLEWVGTGWLIADNILVTNRHVASVFVARKGEGFTFKMGQGGRITANTDFLQEIGNPKTLIFKLVKPLHVESSSGPDVSFFEIDLVSGESKLAKPIALAAKIEMTENVATIGYPAYDSRVPEPDLMERIYGKVYNKKRLAPGGITRIEQTRFWHNCTTLGGNSGSVVVDLDKQAAVGLHFSGSFLESNYAVRADIVKKLLDDVRGGSAKRRVPTPVRKGRQELSAAVNPTRAVRQASASSATLTLPLTVTISLGAPATPSPSLARYSTASISDSEDFIDEDEAVASDYDDRKGYMPDFLGKKGFSVALPKVKHATGDILTFEGDGGAEESELRYEHYSVVMSRSRRMCFLSACNIDGNLSKKSARVAWKWDPRIPREQQIMKECYGSPPKFSRGHMTRREDPGWGNATTAKRGNEDSMHVTNTTPQMQAFNSPIWLALEDYALQHAREDDMKISVFTGPYFAEGDPERYGVRIPLAFWKIIAFIHDETGEFCATGYEMDQQGTLPPEDEFVFGAFTSPQLNVAAQVPIRDIQKRAGIDFGRLVDVDPLADSEESVADGERAPLLALEQITFVR
ncbi:MAG: DNA/RNA non-specific endonuclease [Parvibaculaceae bacterium]